MATILFKHQYYSTAVDTSSVKEAVKADLFYTQSWVFWIVIGIKIKGIAGLWLQQT